MIVIQVVCTAPTLGSRGEGAVNGHRRFDERRANDRNSYRPSDTLSACRPVGFRVATLTRAAACPPRRERQSARSLGVVVFVVGTGSLGAEIAAARLLAPYFGASTLIWANTIGVVLVALSAGYWYGGKRADRDPSPAGLYKIVLLAAVLTALVPFVAHPFLAAAVDALDRISAGAASAQGPSSARFSRC